MLMQVSIPSSSGVGSKRMYEEGLQDGITKPQSLLHQGLEASGVFRAICMNDCIWESPSLLHQG